MQGALQIGDEIVTIGGIVGLVVQVNEDTIVIETTGNRNKIRLKKWAIQENLTLSENTKREQEQRSPLPKPKKKARRKRRMTTPPGMVAS